MALKELKKVVSNKWIILFLVLLCGFNVFFNINYVQKNMEEIKYQNELQQEKIKEYPEYISNMKDNLTDISSFKLFNNGSDYHKKSAEKVVSAYDKLKYTKPESGNYSAVSIITKLGFSDIIIFLIVFQCVIVIINSDRKNRMIRLLKSCKNGRKTLIWAKIKAVFVADVVCVSVVYMSLIIGLILFLGCDNLNVPLQSVTGFYESYLPITIFQYLILFIGFKCLAVFSYSLLLLSVVILFENIGILYSLTGVIIAMSMLANMQILWDYKISFLKIISPITLTDTASLTYKYYNINILGIPFNITSVALIVMLGYIATFISVSVLMFSKNITIQITRDKFKHYKKRKVFIKGMTRIEYRKLLVINKGIIIIVILSVMQGYVIKNTNTELSDIQKYYAAYMEDLEGGQSEETDAYIATEQARFDEIQRKYDKNMQKYLKGEIKEEAFLAINQKYSWEILPYEAFKVVKNQNEYLKKLDKAQNVKGWFIDDIGINYLLHPSEIYNEIVAWIFMMLAMVLLVISCFAYEEESGMKNLTNTMIYGTKKLNLVKWKVSFIITTIVFLISNIPYLLLLLKNYNFSGVCAPIKSLQGLEKFPINMPISAFLILVYILKYTVIIGAMLIVIGIAKKCSGQIKKIAVAFIITVMPLIIIALY